MKRFSFLNKDYFKLFALREGKVVLGNRKANLWLLTIVLSPRSWPSPSAAAACATCTTR